MATAAVADARRKDSRRRELDNEIVEAKSGLASLIGESVAQELAKLAASPFPDLPHSRPLAKKDALDAVGKLHSKYLQELPAKRKHRLEAAQHLRTMLGLDWNPEYPDTRKSTLARCEEVTVAEEQQRNSDPTREPKTVTHMDKVSDMITDLVDRLMVEAWWTTELQAPGTHPALDSPDSASTMIRMLRSDGYPSYSHPDLDPAETLRQRTQLNDFNLKILQDWAPPIRERLVAKICYNLLVCGVSPGIQNYNLLILGFSTLGEHNLSQAVVDSFLFLSHLKPTEATYLCLLQHYRLKGDVVGFNYAIRRMFGYDSRGIGLMRRTRQYVAARPALQDWVATHDVAYVDGHFVERAPLTQDVVETIMEGLIDFGMLRSCAKFFAVCLQEKWTINKDLLWRLSHSILNLLDAQAAETIIRALCENIDQASLLLLATETYTIQVPLVRQTHHLLSIWQAEALPKKVNVEGEESRCGDSTFMSQEAKLSHLVSAIWVMETLHHTSIICHWLKKANYAFSKKKVPLSDRIDKALFALDLATERRMRKTKKAELIRQVAKMDWLIGRVVASERRIRTAENIICQALAQQTPRLLRTWSQFDASVPIDERIELALPYGVPGTVQHAVAECFRVSQEIDYQLNMAFLDALPKAYAHWLRHAQREAGDFSLGRTLAYFTHYLVGLKSQAAEEAKVAQPAPDPFARLLEKLPTPKFSFWKRKSGSATATAEAGGVSAPGHIGW